MNNIINNKEKERILIGCVDGSVHELLLEKGG